MTLLDYHCKIYSVILLAVGVESDVIAVVALVDVVVVVAEVAEVAEVGSWIAEVGSWVAEVAQVGGWVAVLYVFHWLVVDH